MMWDLEAEHESAYSEEICKSINDISDLFDPIFEYMYKLQHLDWCIDVFPCEKNPEIEIPQMIRKYYDIYLEEAYREKMQKLFDITLSGKEFCSGTLEEILRYVMHNTQIGNKEIDWSELDAIIHGIANKLMNDLRQDIVMVYEMNQKDLGVMKEEYFGILFKGYYFKYSHYAFLIVMGSSD